MLLLRGGAVACVTDTKSVFEYTYRYYIVCPINLHSLH
eukprot:COSAG02_NODE_5_length_66751_cov_63.939148_6_plen_38_part_00